MENNKQVILGKDLKIFVGLNEKTLTFKMVPYIYNNTMDKIKDLLDNEIYNKNNSIFDKKYNVKYYGRIDTRTIVCLFKDDEKISEKKLNKIIKKANKIYNIILKRNLKIEKQEKAEKELQNVYKNF